MVIRMTDMTTMMAQPVIPTGRRLSSGGPQVEASLGYRTRLSQAQTTTAKIRTKFPNRQKESQCIVL